MLTSAQKLNTNYSSFEKATNESVTAIAKKVHTLFDTEFRKIEANHFIPKIIEIFNDHFDQDKDTVNLKLSATYTKSFKQIKIMHKKTVGKYLGQNKLENQDFINLFDKFFLEQFDYTPRNINNGIPSKISLKILDIAKTGKGTVTAAPAAPALAAAIFENENYTLWSMYAMTFYKILGVLHKELLSEELFEMIDNAIYGQVDKLYKMLIQGYDNYSQQSIIFTSPIKVYGGRKSRSQKRSKKNSTKRRY